MARRYDKFRLSELLRHNTFYGSAIQPDNAATSFEEGLQDIPVKGGLSLHQGQGSPWKKSTPTAGGCAPSAWVVRHHPPGFRVTIS